MASTINAKNTSTGLVMTPDSSGQLELQTADTTRMTITSGGNVGIGTSSPAAKLHSVSSGAYPARMESTGSTYSAIAYKGTGSSANLAEAGAVADAFYIGTGGAERMRIDASGNVLVNTASQIGSGKLCIQTVLNQDGLKVQGAGGVAGTGYSFSCQQSTGFAAYFNTTSGVSGSIYCSGTTTAYNTSSDYRLKENVQPMVGALNIISQLNPVTYTWKADGSDGQGFIAHELQAIVPDCVTGEKDAVDAEGNPVYQGVDTSFLVATLTAAIQELKAELDTVKAELAELKGAA